MIVSTTPLSNDIGPATCAFSALSIVVFILRVCGLILNIPPFNSPLSAMTVAESVPPPPPPPEIANTAAESRPPEIAPLNAVITTVSSESVAVPNMIDVPFVDQRNQCQQGHG